MTENILGDTLARLTMELQWRKNGMNNAEDREKLINWLAERFAALYGMKPKNNLIVGKAVKLANEIIDRQLIAEAEQVKPWVPIE